MTKICRSSPTLQLLLTKWPSTPACARCLATVKLTLWQLESIVYKDGMPRRVFSAEDLAFLNDQLSIEGQPSSSGLLRHSASRCVTLPDPLFRLTHRHQVSRLLTLWLAHKMLLCIGGALSSPIVPSKWLTGNSSHCLRFMRFWRRICWLLCSCLEGMGAISSLLMYHAYGPSQWILKGKVSLYYWPPVWLVWNQLYENWQFICKTYYSKPVKQEANGTVILPPLVFPDLANPLVTKMCLFIKDWDKLINGQLKNWFETLSH